MKKTLLTIFSIGAFAIGTSAQTFTPAAGSALTGASQGVPYAGQTINADIPNSVTVSGQDIIDVLPAQVATFAGAAINPNDSYTVTVTSTILTVEGLPMGLSDNCSGCTVAAGSNQDISISGTPTEGGMFTVNIASSTAGETTVSVPVVGQVTIPFGGTINVPFVGDFEVPGLPGIMDAEGYTMSVMTGIEEANDIFSLNFYPNPTEGNAILDVNSRESGIAAVEVYSITGSQVLTFSESIRVGVNRVAVDLSSVPAGIYLIKADINGAQALIRTQKI